MGADGNMHISPQNEAGIENYDIFLACPMSAYSGDDYDRMRNSVIDIIKKIRMRDKQSRIFCPAVEIKDLASWDLPQTALEEDLAALEQAELFVMIYTRPIPQKVSSVVVEAGMALAHRIPSLFIVSDRSDLPYLLRSADEFRSAPSRHRRGNFESFGKFEVKIIVLEDGDELADIADSAILSF